MIEYITPMRERLVFLSRLVYCRLFYGVSRWRRWLVCRMSVQHYSNNKIYGRESPAPWKELGLFSVQSTLLPAYGLLRVRPSIRRES